MQRRSRSPRTCIPKPRQTSDGAVLQTRVLLRRRRMRRRRRHEDLALHARHVRRAHRPRLQYRPERRRLDGCRRRRQREGSEQRVAVHRRDSRRRRVLRTVDGVHQRRESQKSCVAEARVQDDAREARCVDRRERDDCLRPYDRAVCVHRRRHGRHERRPRLRARRR